MSIKTIGKQWKIELDQVNFTAMGLPSRNSECNFQLRKLQSALFGWLVKHGTTGVPSGNPRPALV